MPTLFTPARVGSTVLSHRVVMAPLTRMRADMPGSVPGDLMAQYYGQRAGVGGLIIAEATFISPLGRGGYASPGIHTDAQVAGWRKVTSAVHAKGGKIFLQLWHAGRQSHVDLLPPNAVPVAPSAITADVRALLADGPAIASPARELALAEIPEVIEEYRQAAVRAKSAGFDGVEVHAANGYLIDQFLQDNANHRLDAYGGPIENRARFLLQVVEAVVGVWGADRVGVRVGPSNRFGDMGDSGPDATFGYIATALSQYGLAYLHVIEPRVKGSIDEAGRVAVAAATLKPLFGGPVIAAGGFDKAEAEAIIASGGADMVAFGRQFVANPDLPDRLRLDLPLAPYDRTTFYYGNAKGYTDYPALEAPARSAAAG
ncbi:N-ethylmaleimide reductase [Nitrospirillum amazonense]|uniref:N-ethylmaleimide reductase n=1 Tax=Nitrospirillum amazonense TaxID=28077 RepID=A0A560ETW2_9PROT|nr:alkene reductase [Nitrospirillum amazonense]TWB12808.1 N-ethylmaleimide reductase [Nitrospirillum amazonense]